MSQAKSTFSHSHKAIPDVMPVDGILLLLNDARQDQRRSCAAVFSARLEVLASYIAQHEMDAVEAVSALRLEAARIQHEAGEIH